MLGLLFFVFRKEFVAACVNHAFNKSVEGVFDLFKRGFFKVCNIDVVEFFQPEELQSVMVGQENYDWDIFKQVDILFLHFYILPTHIRACLNIFSHLTSNTSRFKPMSLSACWVNILNKNTGRLHILLWIRYAFIHLVFLILQNTVYEGDYRADHPTIITFWEVFENFSAEEKKKFLCMFSTSFCCSCVSFRSTHGSVTFIYLFYVACPSVVSVPHRLWQSPLPGDGVCQDDRGRVARCHRAPFAWIPHLPHPVVAAQLQAIPSEEDDGDQAPPGH